MHIDSLPSRVLVSSPPVVTLVLTLLVSASAAHATGGAVVHWPLNEAGGAVVHDTAGSNNGAVLGGATFVPGGVAGGAMSFSRVTSDRVDFGNVFGFGGSADFSVSLWIRLARGATGDNYPISKHFAGIPNGWIIFIGVSGGCYGDPTRPTFYTNDNCGGEITAPVSVNDGAWHHIVCAYDAGATKQVYVDGGQISVSGPAANISNNPQSQFLFGAVTVGGVPTAAYDGQLDDVQIYDRPLSCAEARYLYTHPGQELVNVIDLTGDGAVNGADLAVLLGAWGACGAGYCAADFNCSGSVEGGDLAVLLGAWTG